LSTLDFRSLNSFSRMSCLASLVLVFFVFLAVPAAAVQVEDLDPETQWKTSKIDITGNDRFPTSQLLGEMVTTTRSWYTFWRSRPHFDPVAFKTDVEKLQRFYRAQGYYDVQVSYDLQADTESQLVTARVTIDEGEPVIVSQVVLHVLDEPTLVTSMETLRSQLLLSEGSVFTEEHYQGAEAQIKAFLLDLHRGRAKVERKATVILDQHRVDVEYAVEAGPVTVFGKQPLKGQRRSSRSLSLVNSNTSLGSCSPRPLSMTRERIS